MTPRSCCLYRQTQATTVEFNFVEFPHQQMPHPSTVIFKRATEGSRSKSVRGSTIMLVEHFLKVLLGLAFESDELDAVSPVPFPSNDGKRDIDREARPG